ALEWSRTEQWWGRASFQTTSSRGSEARGERAELCGYAGCQSLAGRQPVTATGIRARSVSHSFRARHTTHRYRAPPREARRERRFLRAPANGRAPSAHAWACRPRAELSRLRLGAARGDDRGRRRSLRREVLAWSRDTTRHRLRPRLRSSRGAEAADP